MISADVTRVKLDAKERSLLAYQAKCQELRDENDRLLDANETAEHDSQVVLKFLREDAERKDELIESLKKTINQQRELFAAQREDERRTAADELASVRAELTAREAALSKQLGDAQDELFRLQEFKEQKLNMEQRLADGEAERAEMAESHKLALENLERKFLEEKNRLQKEDKQMLAEMKKSSQEEAVERLDSSTKKILFENRRMAEELRLQVQETDELQKAKKALEEETKRLRREVALNEQSVKEYDGTRLGRGAAHAQRHHSFSPPAPPSAGTPSRASASPRRSRSSLQRHAPRPSAPPRGGPPGLHRPLLFFPPPPM